MNAFDWFLCGAFSVVVLAGLLLWFFASGGRE